MKVKIIEPLSYTPVNNYISQMNSRSIIICSAILFVNHLSIGQIKMGVDSVEEKAKSVLAQMTLKQKVNEMHGHGIARFGVSMVFSKRVKQIKAGGNKKLEVPPTVFNDGPRGLFHYKGATAFPTTMSRGASWDIDLERRVGEAMAKEIRALGGNYSGAVCMNLLRHPAWGRAQETYGEDPHHLGEMATALVSGIQQHKVQACVKHFAVNSMENNRFGGNMTIDERTLHDVYLPHFKKTVDNGVASVMSAYNKVNGEYCGHNKQLLTDILRKQWGFKGYVTSDWSYGLFDAQKGIEAGMNVEMPTGKIYNLKAVQKLIREEKISHQQIDDLVLPILRTKLLFASIKEAGTYPKNLVGCKAHIELAREAAEKSAVLLKNENNLLPLGKSAVKKIAVIGSLATVAQTGDMGSSHVFPSYIVSPIEGIRKYFEGTNVEIVTAELSNLVTLKAVCQSADVVIVVAGTTREDEGEYIGDFKIRDKSNPNKKNFVVKWGVLGLGGDRAYLHLHQADIDAINAVALVNKNVVVNLVAGSAITVEEWQENVSAIFYLGYNGMEGGTALARLLFGEVNPSGKLPFTVPMAEQDLPAFDSYAADVEYGYYHGYTLLNKNSVQPRFAFGHGLSYTQFELADLQYEVSDVLNLRVTVSNVGSRAGAEVVQVYIGLSPNEAEASQQDLPKKLLRGFGKVDLQQGETKQVNITIPIAELAHYDSELKEKIVMKGKYNLWVGNSSAEDNMLMGNFEVK